jgi:hypothetical protein
VGNEIVESQSGQWSTDRIARCVSQRSGTKKGLVRSVECILEVAAGIEELPSHAEEWGKAGKESRLG